MCCHVLSAAGKAKEGIQNLLVPMATGGMLVPQQAVPRGACSAHGSAGLAGAGVPHYGRDRTVQQIPCSPPNFQIGEIHDHISARADVGSQPMVQKANLPLAGHPFILLWIETSTAPLAPALCEELPHNYSEAKSSEGRNHHATHTRAKHRAGEGTGLKTPREPWQGGSSTLLLCPRGRSLLRAEQDPGTGSDVCAGSEAKAGLVSPSPGREGGP